MRDELWANQPFGKKVWWYWERLGGTTWEPLGDVTGTHGEHDGNKGKNQKILPPLPTNKITGTLLSPR